MPVAVGARFTLDYQLTENSKLRRDINYSITEMTDESFSVESVDEEGNKVEPCIQLLSNGQFIATKVGYAQIKIRTIDIKDIDATINIGVLPQLEEMIISIEDMTLMI